MSTTYFEIRDTETGEVLGKANTYNGGGGYGIEVETGRERIPYSDSYRAVTQRLTYWDYDYEPDEMVSEMFGRNARLVATAQVGPGFKVTKRYDENGYDENGRDWQGYDADGYDEAGHSMYDEEFYWGKDRDGNSVRRYEVDKDEHGFYPDGIHDNGTERDDDGYDMFGVDKDGYDRDGFNYWSGFNRDGIHRDTGTSRDSQGRDMRGYDDEGYGPDGYDKNGRDRDGRDRLGFDEHGRDRSGCDIWGVDGRGFLHKDWDGPKGVGTPLDGMTQGTNVKTGTRFAPDGLDIDRRNKEGQLVPDTTPRDAEGYDRNGFDRNGIHYATGTDRDERDRDVFGCDRDGYDRNGENLYGSRAMFRHAERVQRMIDETDPMDPDYPHLVDERIRISEAAQRKQLEERGPGDPLAGNEVVEPKRLGLLDRLRGFAGGTSEAQRPSNPFGGDATVSGGKGYEGKPMVDGYEYVNKNGKRVHVDSYKNPRYKGPRR